MLKKIFSHATLVLESVDLRYDFLKQEIKENNISFISFDYDEDNKNFKIEDVRNIINFQNTKSGDKRFIITDRSLRNTVVQNSLLKVLEEPSENTFIVIFTKDLDMFLPTVLSRCQIIKHKDREENKNIDIIKKQVSEMGAIKNKIINNKLDKNRFEKLERFLILENLSQKNLISSKQINDYLDLVK